jgi:hypothetical protein
MPAQAGIQGSQGAGRLRKTPARRLGILVRAKTPDPRARGDDTVARTSVPLSLTAACLGVTAIFPFSAVSGESHRGRAIGARARSRAVSVLVTNGRAKRSDHDGVNHLSGDQIIRLLYSESQEFVDELSLTAFATARHPATPTRLSSGLALRRSQARTPPAAQARGGGREWRSALPWRPAYGTSQTLFRRGAPQDAAVAQW